MSTPLPVSLDAPLDELLDAAGQKYQVDFSTVNAGGRDLELLQITNMAQYVEQIAEASKGAELSLPFWAKIWPSSMLLSHYISTLTPLPGQTMLEMGGGVGVCGLIAASAGYDVTITDINPDALLFTQINILQNNLQDTARVARADFSADRLGQRFDFIIGSEVLYIEKLHRGMVKFIQAHLAPKPHAEVILSKDYTRKTTRFFKLAQQEFLMDEKTIGCSTGDEKHLCSIYRFKPRKQA